MKEYDWDTIQKFVRELSNNSVFDEKNRSLLIYQQGGQGRNLHWQLKGDDKFEILWSGSCLPIWLFPLRIIPNRSGLFKVNKSTDLWYTLHKVWSMTFITICFVDKSIEDKILKRLKKLVKIRLNEFDIDDIILEDEDFVKIEIDTDYDKPLMKIDCANSNKIKRIQSILEKFVE
jgi:hypothetical protein